MEFLCFFCGDDLVEIDDGDEDFGKIFGDDDDDGEKMIFSIF